MRGCNSTHIRPQKGPINNPVKPLTISSVLRRLVNHLGFIQSGIILFVCELMCVRGELLVYFLS